MRVKQKVRTIGACMAVVSAASFAAGCSFDPVAYVSRNACEFVNCDELFFIEDILPLSARPSGNAGSESGMVMDTSEDEGGGHTH